VEKLYPCLVPFLELEDGRTIAAVDARMISSGRRWQERHSSLESLGGCRGQSWSSCGSGPGLRSDLDPSRTSLHRLESLTASKPLRILRLWLAIPSRNSHLETLELNGTRIDRLTRRNDPGCAGQALGLASPISAYATATILLVEEIEELFPCT